ncbi:MAG TPA: hypothetical protein GXX24_09800 [Paracoccus solventivorans]|uniref:Phage tail fibre repeat-containing protein n=1 Tax=Paracoccus solventivorans TaxID=53463 RepID=A0A832QYK6_9RHOB|nr:hypothetical protein [Paracoccus solventivorans]HHW34413.1 hypothetical protein [Paracoccus solventivorans]
MGIKDDINRILRDHEGYTGDGRGGVGDLPIGDRSTARKPISKRDLREVLGAVHDSVADPAAAAGQAAADAADAAERAELAAAGVEYPVSYAPQTLTAPQRAQARSNIGAADSATAVVDTRTITAGAGLTGGGNLTANRTIAADFATQAEALAGSAADKVMTPLRVMEAVPAALNAAGAAPVYACRAWVAFKGTSPVSILASGNVSSVTRTAAGVYRLNFVTAMQDANYAVSAAAGLASAGGRIVVAPNASRLVGSVVIETRLLGSTISPGDADYVGVAIFR